MVQPPTSKALPSINFETPFPKVKKDLPTPQPQNDPTRVRPHLEYMKTKKTRLKIISVPTATPITVQECTPITIYPYYSDGQWAARYLQSAGCRLD